MEAILAIFRGEATLAGAPAQQFETTTTLAADTGDTSDTGEALPATTLPTVAAEENTVGVAPDRANLCD
jgi:hypothetical protein